MLFHYNTIQSNGIPFIINGQTVYLRGSLILGCGDNPAANLLSGYKNLTSAFRKCRSCMATTSDIQTKVALYLYAYMYYTVLIIMASHQTLSCQCKH